MPRKEDVFAGQQIKLRRTVLKMTQKDLSDGLGVSFQQLQKYETGCNRISVSRLCDIAVILQCDPDYFFKGAFTHHTENEALMLHHMRNLNDDMQQVLLSLAERISIQQQDSQISHRRPHDQGDRQ